MVERTRALVPEARVERASAYDASVPAGCVAVLAIGEVLSYLADPRAGMEALERLTERVHRSLAPGGMLLFDLIAPGRNRGLRETQLRHDRPDYELVVTSIEATERGVLDRRISGVWRRGGTEVEIDEHHVQWICDPDAVTALLVASGFSVRASAAYGSGQELAGWAVFTATRPS
jgi:hypothetical protein